MTLLLIVSLLLLVASYFTRGRRSEVLCWLSIAGVALLLLLMWCGERVTL